MKAADLMPDEIVTDCDGALVERASAGDTGAFSELVKKYERLIYNTAYSLTGNQDDACDISQDCFLKAYRSLQNFRGDCKFSTWLYRICQNTAKDFIRSRVKRATVSLSDFDDEDKPDGIHDIPDENVSVHPEELLEKSELRDLVRAAVQRLSEDHRNAIILRDIEGYSYEEIADMLGIEIGTVKSRINRARQAVKEYLIRMGAV